jgi:hypothetical protein
MSQLAAHRKNANGASIKAPFGVSFFHWVAFEVLWRKFWLESETAESAFSATSSRTAHKKL